MEIADYIKLTVDLQKPLTESLDNSRPFILSSPTNGKESEVEGGVAKNPYDQHYGDLHFYDYSKNLWQPGDDTWHTSFTTPRCSSEYGLQSIPLTSTMNKWINHDEWTFGSSWMTRRQHHPDGNSQNLALAFDFHFEVKN